MKNMRIANLRRAVRDNGLAAYYLNSNDYHLSEYVPEYFRTIAYFSGFTGSVSTLIVDPEKAYIFVDGHYHIQAEQECLPNEVEVIKLGTEGALQPEDFLASRYKGKTVGIDGKRTSIDFAKKLLKKGLQLKSIDIYSAFIESRVPLSCDKLRELPLEETGLSRKEKLRRVRYCLGGRTHVIDNLESIAWLLNLRGNDIAYTPVFLSFVVFYHDDVYFFIDLERLDEGLLERLYDDGVIIRPYAS
ncbi:MAG: aminopeptidase P family N-terminal domain-containing protein, partial [Erysipelotrichaceae bacterium]|nr:aminopeptidase P family N-terminal domain-containing protein [Erysipelotrichaceae bacterium]